MDENTYSKELENCALAVSAGFVMQADEYGYLPPTLFLAGLVCSVDIIEEKMTPEEIETAKKIAARLRERKGEFLPDLEREFPELSRIPKHPNAD